MTAMHSLEQFEEGNDRIKATEETYRQMITGLLWFLLGMSIMAIPAVAINIGLVRNEPGFVFGALIVDVLLMALSIPALKNRIRASKPRQQRITVVDHGQDDFVATIDNGDGIGLRGSTAAEAVGRLVQENPIALNVIVHVEQKPHFLYPEGS